MAQKIRKVKNGVSKMGKIISWLIPIGMLITSLIIPFIPLSPEEEKSREKPSERTVFVQNRKDVIAEFGNARFVILRAYNKDKKEAYWILYDNAKFAIERKVKNFTQVEPNVYTVGENGYIKLNYETAETVQSKEIPKFLEEDQRIFKKLEAEKIRAIR